MCLESGFKSIEKSGAVQSGWKVFVGTSSQPAFQSMTYKNSALVPLDKWIAAEGGQIKTGGLLSGGYDAGFHIFEDEQELKAISNWSGTTGTKRRVYYRNAHTRGKQSGATIVVALDMYVPSDPDGWPPL